MVGLLHADGAVSAGSGAGDGLGGDVRRSIISSGEAVDEGLGGGNLGKGEYGEFKHFIY